MRKRENAKGMPKVNWWIVSGLVFLVMGISGLLLFQSQFLAIPGVEQSESTSQITKILDPILNILVGILLLKHRLIGFYIALIVVGVSFLFGILTFTGNFENGAIIIIQFLVLLVLWQLWEEIRRSRARPNKR
ncbi:hypothetical protein CMO96_00090 [Candidatus Woesebacteria bacterium]|nr:hypothetical protein [Candidatus Woesebacteria bacterium]|tara:strand:- start:8 stop:406 length:399 start_codon:yes stop_codon:yes gene_type:complete